MTLPSAVEQRLEPLSLPNEGYRSVLGNRNFLALWLGQVFSQLGDRVVFVVFIAAITTYFGSSDSYNSYLYIAFTIPAILLTAIAGVFVDRWPRRLVLVATNLLRAFFVGFLPLAANAGLLGIYALAFLLSAATQFFVPAEAATIPMIVRKTQLMTANSLFTTTMMASVIFGFALGDPLINIFGLKQVHWAMVGLFALSAVILCLVRIPPAEPPEAFDHTPDSLPDQTSGLSLGQFFHEIRDGLTYIHHNRLILQAMLKLALLFSAVVAMCILFISFARDYLYADPAVASRKFAYIVAFSGIGMALGAFAVGRFFRDARRSLLVFGGFTGAGLFLLLLSLVEVIPKTSLVFDFPEGRFHLPGLLLFLDRVVVTYRMVFTYFLAALMGAGAAFVAIPLQSLLHEKIPRDKRGKIMGVQFTLLSTGSTLPVLAAGLGVEFFGTQTMLILIGVPLLVVGLVGLYRRLALRHATAEAW